MEDAPPDADALLSALRKAVREVVREELDRREAEEKRLLTKKEVAARLRCSERTVDTLAAEGSLRKIKVGRLVRFSPEAVDAYIRRQARS